MSTVTVNGNTYSDAGESANDMRDGGHRTHLLPMLSDSVVDLAAKVSAAGASETAAAAFAAAAVNAPGTNATSTTFNTIGTGDKSFTIQTGKLLQPGMCLVIADAAAPQSNSMFGRIVSYDDQTGALVVNVTIIAGGGTKTSWLLSLSSPGGALAGTALGDIDMAGYVFTSAKTKNSSEQLTAGGNISGAAAFNLSTADVFTATVAGAVTISFTNPPASGLHRVFLLYLTNGGAYAVTWPTVKWDYGAAPSLTPYGTDVLAFSTRDGGATWFGFVLSKGAA